MSDLFLIAHKVRGEPAFDVATRVQIGEEEGWIIPTSGHRAYPYWFCSLLDLGIGILPDGCWAYGIDPVYLQCKGLIPIPPDDWRDHYEVTRETSQRGPKAKIETIDLAELGL